MKNLLLTLIGILLLAPINLLANTSPSDWKREMVIASHQAAAKADLSICRPHALVEEDLEVWSCEAAIQGAIRAGLELEEIIIPVVAGALAVLVGDSFNESNMEKESLVSGINLLITRIDVDSIGEENIVAVSRKINLAAQSLANKHYYP